MEVNTVTLARETVTKAHSLVTDAQANVDRAINTRNLEEIEGAIRELRNIERRISVARYTVEEAENERKLSERQMYFGQVADRVRSVTREFPDPRNAFPDAKALILILPIVNHGYNGTTVYAASEDLAKSVQRIAERQVGGHRGTPKGRNVFNVTDPKGKMLGDFESREFIRVCGELASKDWRDKALSPDARPLISHNAYDLAEHIATLGYKVVRSKRINN